MRIACAQINTVVGDIAGNSDRILLALDEAADRGVDLTLFPELAVTGYPPEDLLLRPALLERAAAALERIAARVRRGVAVVGLPLWEGDCVNAAAVLADGAVRAIYRKRHLPNYGVFDEARHFRPGTGPAVVALGPLRVGLAICEDVWRPAPAVPPGDADLLCVIAASPYERGKGARREAMLATRAADAGMALAFCNAVGGQDDLVFDGRSTVFDADGALRARAPQFGEHLLVAEIDPAAAARHRLREPRARGAAAASPSAPLWSGPAAPPQATPTAGPVAPALEGEAEVWAALVRGLGDYVDKNGFPGVLLGLSGGIDSALCAALAVDALGAGRVQGVAMPSAHSAPESLRGARRLAAGLGIRCEVLPIGPTVATLEGALEDLLGPAAPPVMYENLQARARGTLLMGLSNARNGLVLATGNKSEIAVGYSTLYGDMVGGFAPLRDVTKTWVYRLSRWRNREAGREVIPVETIERPPTAELRPGQLDTDSLPSYDTLDPMVEGYVEQGFGVDELVARGAERALAERVVAMIDRAEYKRRQGAPGTRITAVAFGRDRRLPITARRG